MGAINIEAITQKYNLDKKELAGQLFPGNKYPVLALRRVEKGEAFLDSEQISKLASILGVPISSLFDGTEWSKNMSDGRVVLTTGDYRAELDTKDWTTKIFHKNSLFHDAVIHSGTIALSTYIGKLNLLISKYIENE